MYAALAPLRSFDKSILLPMSFAFLHLGTFTLSSMSLSFIHLATIDESLHPVIVDDTLRPPPDLIDDKEEYEVESILDHKHGKRQRQYLVKWKGYPLSETSWQSRSDLRHARDVVLAYEASLT